MQLKYSIIRDQHLTNALRKLGNCPKFPPKFAMQISKLMDAMYDQESKIAVEYQALIDAHATKDEKGEYIPREDPNGDKIPGSFKPLDTEKWSKAHDDFGNQTFKVPVSPLPIKQLEGVGLTPLELRAIEPLVTEVDLSIS